MKFDEAKSSFSLYVVLLCCCCCYHLLVDPSMYVKMEGEGEMARGEIRERGIKSV